MTTSNYAENYFKNYSSGKGYDSQAANPTFIKRLKELTHLGKATGTLLDIGCAWGYFAHQAHKRGFTVTGIDISPQAIAKATQLNPHITWAVADISAHLPWKKKKFDIIVMDNTLEHVPNYHQALKNTYHLLNHKGILHIHVPTNNRWTVDPTHINYFTVPQLTLVLERLGFKVLKIGEEGGKLRNIYGIIRLIKNRHTYFNYVPRGTGAFIAAYAQKL